MKSIEDLKHGVYLLDQHSGRDTREELDDAVDALSAALDELAALREAVKRRGEMRHFDGGDGGPSCPKKVYVDPYTQRNYLASNLPCDCGATKWNELVRSVQ